jgi:hypothetical protein
LKGLLIIRKACPVAGPRKQKISFHEVNQERIRHFSELTTLVYQVRLIDRAKFKLDECDESKIAD